MQIQIHLIVCTVVIHEMKPNTGKNRFIYFVDYNQVQI